MSRLTSKFQQYEFFEFKCSQICYNMIFFVKDVSRSEIQNNKPKLHFNI